MSFPHLDFFQMIHSIAAYYSPPEMSKPFQCVVESACEMIPKKDPLRNILQEAIRVVPMSDMVSPSDALEWTYRLNTYVNRQLYGSEYMTYNKFIDKYDQKNMTIETWSRPSWKMIHYFAAKYDGTKEYALLYKAFVSCLQFVLPCPNCRKHLRDNLANHPIDQYFGSAIDLFTWSYILHQTVSSQIGKQGISLAEAKRLYGL